MNLELEDCLYVRSVKKKVFLREPVKRGAFSQTDNNFLAGSFACRLVPFGGGWGRNDSLAVRFHIDLEKQAVTSCDSAGWMNDYHMANARPLRVEGFLYR